MAVEIKTKWAGELDVIVYNDSGHTMYLSNSGFSGGIKKGLTPMEALLGALASCTMMDVVSILKKKRVEFTGLEVNAHGERVEGYPKVYSRINLEYIIKGNEINRRDVERAVELSISKYCPVNAILKSAGVDITYKITII